MRAGRGKRGRKERVSERHICCGKRNSERRAEGEMHRGLKKKKMMMITKKKKKKNTKKQGER